MSANNSGSILTRPPRLIRKADGFLSDRLEPGESVVSAFRVRTASLWFGMAVGLGGLVLWDILLHFIFLGHETSGWHDGLFFGLSLLGVFIAIVGKIQLQKPRLWALTDRRLFVLITSPLLEKVRSIETEERRATIKATLLSKSRVVVSGDKHGAMRVRVPAGSSAVMGEYLRDWAEPSRPDA